MLVQAILFLSVVVLVIGLVLFGVEYYQDMRGIARTANIQRVKVPALDLETDRLSIIMIGISAALAVPTIILARAWPAQSVEASAIALPTADWRIHLYSCMVPQVESDLLRNVVRSELGYVHGATRYKAARTVNLADTSAVIYYGGNERMAQAFAGRLAERLGRKFTTLKGNGAGLRITNPEKTLIVNLIGPDCENQSRSWF